MKTWIMQEIPGFRQGFRIMQGEEEIVRHPFDFILLQIIVDAHNREEMDKALQEIERLRISWANWKKCSEAQQKDIQDLSNEVKRLRNFLRSMPKSFGITERDIQP